MIQYNERSSRVTRMMADSLEKLEQNYRSGSDESSRQIVKQIVDTLDSGRMKWTCADKTLTLIVQDAAVRCEGAGISFRPEDMSGVLGSMEPFDITAIFANLLDNARRAASKTDTPAVSLDLKRVRQMLVVTVENTALKPPKIKNGHYVSTKKDPGHGLGIMNVEKKVGKYHGSMDLSFKDGVFTAQLYLPVYQEEESA